MKARLILTIISTLVCLLQSPLGLANAQEGIQFYQANNHLSPEHKQKLAEDLIRYHNADDLWQEIRDNFAMNHYEDDPMVQEQINWFMSHQDFLYRSTSRAAPYLYYILQQARLHHLPSEVVLLPIFESAYNPFAYSPQGASGIWQMMPRTANGYGIKQDWWFDGRRDVIASTKAAMNYLAYLKTFFDGNWILAIAAYDSGEGTVQNAVLRNIHKGNNTDFRSLGLPEETRIYVPRLFALATIIANPDRYPVNLPRVKNAAYLAQVEIGGQMDLKHAASIAGLNLRDLIALNPGYNRSSTNPSGHNKLVLPIENVETFTENLSSLPETNRINWENHLVKHGETILNLAALYRTTPSLIRKMNQMASNTLRPGKMILLPHKVPAISETLLEADKEHYFSADDDSPMRKKTLVGLIKSHLKKNPERSQEHLFARSTGNYHIKPGDTIYLARTGDTYENIAARYRISAEDLKAVNPKMSHLRSGDKLIIPTHIKRSQFAKVSSGENLDLSPSDKIYRVQTGDSIEKIAEKFHTSVSAIRLANLLRSDQLTVGEPLVIKIQA